MDMFIISVPLLPTASCAKLCIEFNWVNVCILTIIDAEIKERIALHVSIVTLGTNPQNVKLFGTDKIPAPSVEFNMFSAVGITPVYDC